MARGWIATPCLPDFLRDRARSDRTQVDTVGIWGMIKRDPALPGGRRVDDVEIKIHIRNASELPIEVIQMAWTLQTQWLIPSEDHPYPEVMVRRSMKGKPDVMRFLGAVGVAPQETFASQWYPTNLAHTAPADDTLLLFFSEGVKCVISYALITDNADRRWEVRQRQGKPAKRIRWYSRSGPHYPVDWQNPVGRRFRVLKAKAKEWVRQSRERARNLRRRPLLPACQRVPGQAQHLHRPISSSQVVACPKPRRASLAPDLRTPSYSVSS
jgi:hypothetical protein